MQNNWFPVSLFDEHLFINNEELLNSINFYWNLTPNTKCLKLYTSIVVLWLSGYFYNFLESSRTFWSHLILSDVQFAALYKRGPWFGCHLHNAYARTLSRHFISSLFQVSFDSFLTNIVLNKWHIFFMFVIVTFVCQYIVFATWILFFGLFLFCEVTWESHHYRGIPPTARHVIHSSNLSNRPKKKGPDYCNGLKKQHEKLSLAVNF